MRRRRNRRGAPAMVAALLIAGCAGTSYPGIDMDAPAASAAAAELQALAARARADDKHAQLELGKRYEAGDGVPCDLDVARKLYAKAASDSGGTVQVYSPPVGEEKAGRVVTVDHGPRQKGLEEAQDRLSSIPWRCAAATAV